MARARVPQRLLAAQPLQPGRQVDAADGEVIRRELVIPERCLHVHHYPAERVDRLGEGADLDGRPAVDWLSNQIAHDADRKLRSYLAICRVDLLLPDSRDRQVEVTRDRD